MFDRFTDDKLNINEDNIESVSFEENEKDEYDIAEKVKTNNILKADITSYSNGLQIESVISSLVSGYYIIPKFQRKYIWKKSQVANLALSLMKDVPIPPIYLYVNERKKHVILDGQQRVTSLFLYFNDLWYVGTEEYRRLDFYRINELNTKLKEAEADIQSIISDASLSKKEQSSKLKAAKQEAKLYANELKNLGLVRTNFFVEDGKANTEISFSSFTEDEKEFLKRKRLDLTIVECRSGNAPKVYAEIFKHLNCGGKLLSAQEVRNGVYWELELYDKLFEVNKNKQWRAIYGKESVVSKDVEILLKILALNYYTEVKDNQINIVYDGTFNWSNIMEEYSDIAATWSTEEVSRQISLLTNYLNKITNIIDNSENRCNKAVFEASFVAFTKINCNESIDYEWLRSLDKEEEFQKGNVLSNKQSVEDRLTKALKKFREKYCV